MIGLPVDWLTPNLLARLKQSRKDAYQAYRRRDLYRAWIELEGDTGPMHIRVPVRHKDDPVAIRQRLIPMGLDGPVRDGRVLHVEVLGNRAHDIMLRLVRRRTDGGEAEGYVFRVIVPHWFGRQDDIFIRLFRRVSACTVWIGGQYVEVSTIYNGVLHGVGQDLPAGWRPEPREVIDFN